MGNADRNVVKFQNLCLSRILIGKTVKAIMTKEEKKVTWPMEINANPIVNQTTKLKAVYHAILVT